MRNGAWARPNISRVSARPTQQPVPAHADCAAGDSSLQRSPAFYFVEVCATARVLLWIWRVGLLASHAAATCIDRLNHPGQCAAYCAADGGMTIGFSILACSPARRGERVVSWWGIRPHCWTSRGGCDSPPYFRACQRLRLRWRGRNRPRQNIRCDVAGSAFLTVGTAHGAERPIGANFSCPKTPRGIPVYPSIIIIGRGQPAPAIERFSLW